MKQSTSERDSSSNAESMHIFQTRPPAESISTHHGPRQAFVQTIRSLWAPQTIETEKLDVEVFHLLLSSHKRKRDNRKYFFKEHLEFSWLRFLSGLISLILVCSDVPRSGLAITRFPAMYPTLEPDVFQSFGPWFYSVQKLSRDTAKNATARLWSYKYDTTSISHHAFAEFFKLQTYPDCVMYRSHCANSTLNGKVVFEMLDSLVNAAATHRTWSGSSEEIRTEPTRITLKTENAFLDRLHQYVLSQVFVSYIWRTNQLFYYSPKSLYAPSKTIKSICSDFRVHPSFCHELWINYRRSCMKANTACKAVGLLWMDAIRRMEAVQRKFPAAQVDLTLLESQEDVQGIKGGISPTGVRKADVTAIIRARQCAIGGVDNGDFDQERCSTVFIDEHRYEMGMVYSEAVQWFRVVACLRVIGQGYYYVRIAMLLVFCFKMYEENPEGAVEPRRIRLWRRVQETVTLFLKTPMQSVIFGSPFPIFCYALAHSMDAAISYELLSKKFTTQGGIFHINFKDFMTVGFNQMRSVWLLTAVLHVSIHISTSRRKLRWSPISGVYGVPEFLMSGLSSITIFAQYRSTSFRNTNIRKLFEAIDSSTVQTIKSRQNMTLRGSGNTQLGGTWIDLKIFATMLALLLTVYFTRRLASRCAWCRAAKSSSCSQANLKGMQTRTPVPHSAGILWPIGAMSVHWTSDYFCVKRPKKGDATTIRRFTKLTNKTALKIAPEPLDHSKANWRHMASFSRERFTGAFESLPSLIMMNSRDFCSIQSRMEVLHKRSDDVEATIAFMNLVNMSDPLVYFCIITSGGGGKPLGYYQSLRSPERFFLLPLGCDANYSINIPTQDLKLVYRVRSSLLSLSDLVHCG